METRDYQAVVIGAGPGGYPAGIRLAQLGIKTLVIEREYWGGVCLNVGCIPSKALITASKKYKEVQNLEILGITIPGAPVLDMGKLQEWKSSIVTKLTGGVSTLLKANGADMLFGEANITKPGEVEVETADGKVLVRAPHIVIATGSRPIQIPGFAYADDRVMDSTKALALDTVPDDLVVIGGGYIGLELGTMMAKVGSNVTVVEMQGNVLPGFDMDCVRLIKRRLKKNGIKVLTNAKALGWDEDDDKAIVRIETKKGVEEIPADKILVTVGRFPNSEPFKHLNLEMEGRHIKIDRQQQTSVPGIYAIGDVATGLMLAHKATHEGEVVAEVIAGHKTFNDARTVPAVVFTDPEIATAGLQEHEAREAGFDVKVGKFPWAANGRALTQLETDGFVKVVLDATDDRVLGVTIIGPHASDLISEATLAVEMDAEALDIGLAIHPHPTLGEAVMEASKAALGEAVHIVNRR
ncbi:MAG TPA: dihydrolipoyl dehydrogenase [Deltaproteobacteria bacterium]|nr:dihydrolipoyl dehydrogenase [Deltaproteobacteria bacterium]